MTQKRNVLLALSCAFNPPPLTGYGFGRYTGEERTEQYSQGFKTFFSQPHLFKNCDVVITDNTISGIQDIDKRIVETIPENSTIVSIGNNEIGRLNNGAGLIFSWLCIANKIKDYEWVIHHEPRQKTRHHNFVSSFFSNPRNLFTVNKDHGKHFNTGLFCIRSENLLEYCVSVDLIDMVRKSISIEDHIFDFFNKNKIQFELAEEMGLTWYPYGGNPVEY